MGAHLGGEGELIAPAKSDIGRRQIFRNNVKTF